MPMYNLIEYIDNYSKTSGDLRPYYRDKPSDTITLAGGNTKNVEIAVPLKYLSNFWRTLEMPIITCEINLILTWSSTCLVTNSTSVGSFAITDTKL